MNTTKSELIGVWKSDSEKTLRSMRNVDGITCKAKQLFENNFFGHLIAEYTERKSRFYFDRKDDNTAGMKSFSPYRLVEETAEKFVVQYFDELENEEITKEL